MATTIDENDHHACVNAWIERAVAGLPLEDMIPALERGFTALWRRAHQTLGDATLTAITDRVLRDTAERHPVLSALQLEPDGLRCPELRGSPGSVRPDQLVEGIRFVLVEFLTVLGDLTADIITASLHAALGEVAPASQSRRARRGGGK